MKEQCFLVREDRRGRGMTVLVLKMPHFPASVLYSAISTYSLNRNKTEA